MKYEFTRYAIVEEVVSIEADSFADAMRLLHEDQVDYQFETNLGVVHELGAAGIKDVWRTGSSGKAEQVPVDVVIREAEPYNESVFNGRRTEDAIFAERAFRDKYEKRE